MVTWILGQKERKTVRQLRKRGNVYKVGKQWKKTKIITNNFLARDLKVAIVTMEMIVNILMMYTCTLEHVTISALHRKKLKLITSRYCYKQQYQPKSPVKTPKARLTCQVLRSTEQREIILRSRCSWWNPGFSLISYTGQFSFSVKWCLVTSGPHTHIILHPRLFLYFWVHIWVVVWRIDYRDRDN